MLSTRKLLLAFLTLFLIALPLAAQIDKATVDAVAVDQSKAPLPGVTVTLTRPATGLQMVAVTDSAGIARFNSLSPGSYSVQFSLEGFAAVKQTNLELIVGQNARISVTMQARKQKRCGESDEGD